MRSYFGCFALTFAMQYHVNENSGTVFEETLVAQMFFEEMELDINLEIFSPRHLLDFQKYEECNNQLQVNNGNGFCTEQFDIYDIGIGKSLKQDIFAHNKKSPKIQIQETATIEMKHLNKNTETTAIDMPLLKRKKRIIGAIVGGTVVIGTAISSFFIGKTITEKATDEINQKIAFNENALFNLTKQVDITTTNLVELEKILKSDIDIVLSGNSDLDWKTQFEAGKYYEEFKNSIENGFQMEIKVADVIHISEVADEHLKKFKDWILSLQTGKIPMEQDFVFAIQVKCRSVQKTNNLASQEFCRNFALKSTMHTEMVNFQGIGFSYFEETGKFKESIRSSILRFSVVVPILRTDTTMKLMKILNVGKIQPDNTLKMVKLPEYAISKFGEIYPLDIKKCHKYGESEVCPFPAFLHHDDCLSSIFNTSLEGECDIIQKTRNLTCDVIYAENAAILTLVGNSTSYVRFKETWTKLREISKFGIISYQDKEIVVECSDGQYITVPAMKHKKMEKIEIFSLISNNQIKLRKQNTNDRISILEKTLQKNQMDIANQILNHGKLYERFTSTNSTLEYLKNNAKNGLIKIEQKVGIVWSNVKRWIVWMGVAVIGTIVLACILWKLSCFAIRFHISKNTNAQIRLIRQEPVNLTV